MQLNRTLLILFACTVLILNSTAQPVIEILNDRYVHNIGDKITMYEDELHRLSIKDILVPETRKKFRLSEQAIINIGVTDAALWCEFSLLNNTNQDCYLEISNTALDSISVYEAFSQDSFAEKKSGAYVNFNSRELRNNNYLFILSGKTDHPKTFYLRVRHNRGTQFSICAGTLKGFSEAHHKVDFIQGIYFGIMVLIIFYNLVVYFSVRDTSYLFYVLYVAIMTLLNASLNGYAFEYLWSNHSWFNRYEDIISAFLGISGVLFAKSFLHIKQNFPFMHKIFNGLIILFSAGIIIVLTGNFMTGTIFIEIVSLLLIIIFLIAAIAVLRKGYKPARFFLFAWSFLLLGVVIFVLKDFDIIPSSTITVHSLEISSAIEALLLSFALANRINIYKKEKEEAQLQTLKQLKENEQLILEQNVMLETKVNERTRELKESQQQLIQQEKMASLGQLTAGVAHEINNPINFVTANISSLKRNFNELVDFFIQKKEVNTDDLNYTIDETKQLLKGIEEGAHRTTEIVKGLRNFTRLDEGEKKNSNIIEGIESTLLLINNLLAEKNIDVIKSYGTLPPLTCYPGQLNQVFINVITNAIDAIGEKGKIYISTSAENNHVRISIKDTGKGMSDEVKKKIFDPFFTTKDVGKGPGLGLSISYSIIEKHNGKIEVKSEVGTGSEFVISLPG
ncbi:MAG TPA: 7TM diverse intracellular signaling domain-containing protein [Bacteroidia bacterium]|nr:7TM diverse intracellular signaling domain-containing protein [Bacteroidia bacterium]